MANKFTNRYLSFCNSLASLRRAEGRDASDEFVLSGTVQKFSLTFDISWKVMKDIITKYHGITDFASGSPKETLRTARSVDLINDDIWLNMLDDRSELTHDYDGSMTKECFERIIHEYIPIFTEFQQKAEAYIFQISNT